MHTRCTRADIKLVRSMGIPVDEVRAKEVEAEKVSAGRVTIGRSGQRTRPSLRVVGLMVVAGVRMQKAAERWGDVKGVHDVLMKKLAAVRKEREGRRMR